MQVNIEQLQEIFQDAFNEPVQITLSTKKNDLEVWDSINHLNLVVELEDRYVVKLTREEIETLDSVSGILQLLNQKLQ
jgi:acyl carrier protein